MAGSQYMDREVASVAGLKYVNKGQARKTADKELAKESTSKSNGNGKSNRKRGSK